MAKVYQTQEMRNRISRTTKEAIRVNLRSFALAGIIELTLLYFLIVYAINLLDVRLIVSLVVVEIPTALFLSYLFGERRRARILDAVEHLRAAKEFSHLVAHQFTKFPFPFRVMFYSVENTKRRRAYMAPNFIMHLGDMGIIQLVKHKGEARLLDYFRSNSIPFEEREATANELD